MNVLSNLPSQRLREQQQQVVERINPREKRIPSIRSHEDVVIERSRRPYAVLTEDQWITMMYGCILAAHLVEDKTRELIETMKAEKKYKFALKQDLNKLLELTSKSSRQTYKVLDCVESPEEKEAREAYQKKTGKGVKVHVGKHRNIAKTLYTIMTALFDEKMENDLEKMKLCCPIGGNKDFYMLVEVCKLFFLVRESAKAIAEKKEIRYNHFDDMDRARIEAYLYTIADALKIDMLYRSKELDKWRVSIAKKLMTWSFIRDLMIEGENVMKETEL